MKTNEKRLLSYTIEILVNVIDQMLQSVIITMGNQKTYLFKLKT